MKKGIHPKWNNSVEIKLSGQTIMKAGSTSDQINVEIWSGNHPFYTGKQILVDTDNLADKFNKKLEASKKLQESAPSKILSRKERRMQRREKATERLKSSPVTLKDMLSKLS